MKILLLFLATLLIVAGGAVLMAARPGSSSLAADVPPPGGKRVIKTEAEWKKILTPDQYAVLRQHGTERAFTSPLVDNHEHGVFVCAGCKTPLFKSETKFESGTGWPSFYQPLANNVVRDVKDSSYGMVRTEVVCNVCGGHLGHVFPDGPKPTGLRYCMNGVAMLFNKQ